MLVASRVACGALQYRHTLVGASNRFSVITGTFHSSFPVLQVGTQPGRVFQDTYEMFQKLREAIR